MVTETIKPGEPAIKIETLKNDKRQLTNDFREAMYFLGKKSKETIKGGGDRIGNALRSMGESARKTTANVYENISNRGKNAVEKSRERIALRPFTYVLAALTAGVLVGAVLKRS